MSGGHLFFHFFFIALKMITIFALAKRTVFSQTGSDKGQTMSDISRTKSFSTLLLFETYRFYGLFEAWWGLPQIAGL